MELLGAYLLEEPWGAGTGGMHVAVAMMPMETVELPSCWLATGLRTLVMARSPQGALEILSKEYMTLQVPKAF